MQLNNWILPMKKPLVIISPEEIKNQEWAKHRGVSDSLRVTVSRLLENDNLVTIFNTFKTRYPYGIDYRLWEDKIEWKDYLRLEVGNKKYFITCDIWNENMPNEHIRLNVFSNLDFWSSKSKKVEIFKDWKLTTWQSKTWEKDAAIECLDMSWLLSSFLRKISTY